jgi:hypothetical protein
MCEICYIALSTSLSLLVNNVGALISKREKMKRIAVIGAIVSLAGCAANSGIIPMGQDSYMVSRQAATGFSGLGNLKGEALQEANQHCLSQGRVMQVTNTSESRPPYILGNYPKAEVQFLCLNRDDPQLVRTVMQKVPDTVIEVRK